LGFRWRGRSCRGICDIDLSILGRPPAEYAAYAAAIRLEYAWVPPPQYAEGRSRVLGGFLKREALFHHMEFQQRFDAPAKVNLTWELCELAAELPGQFQPTIP
jgi:predicted metal-dependent HD superfamily phosphohydrolase